jgi:ABC-2 type transport system ATP-binding protein
MIEVRHASKCFGKIRALDDVSFTIAAGERVALVGTNGSGKTTLLRAMLGLVRCEGAITVAGVDVALAPERALRHIAYVPQIAPPLDAPVRDVVRAVTSLRGFSEDAVTRQAALLGLDMRQCSASRFRDLSGGMKQKLLAALALAADTGVLLCDEPTANLDGAAREAFVAALRDLSPERSVVLCSHRIAELEGIVDRVIELRDGVVARDEAVVATPERRSIRAGLAARYERLRVVS